MSKSVHLYEISGAMQIVLENGGEVAFVTSGFSMLPLLRNHMDTAVLRKPDRPLKKGDVIFYRMNEKQFILHRITSIKNGEITTRGDNQKVSETGIHENQVMAVLVRVQRADGKTIDCKSASYRFYVRFLPLVRLFRHRIYPIYVKLFAPIVRRVFKK